MITCSELRQFVVKALTSSRSGRHPPSSCPSKKLALVPLSEKSSRFASLIRRNIWNNLGAFFYLKREIRHIIQLAVVVCTDRRFKQNRDGKWGLFELVEFWVWQPNTEMCTGSHQSIVETVERHRRHSVWVATVKLANMLSVLNRFNKFNSNQAKESPTLP